MERVGWISGAVGCGLLGRDADLDGVGREMLMVKISSVVASKSVRGQSTLYRGFWKEILGLKCVGMRKEKYASAVILLCWIAYVYTFSLLEFA